MDSLLLINKENKLEADYIPDDLLLIEETGELLNSEAYTFFREMQEAASKEGYHFRVESGYRSYAHQQDLLRRITEAKGKEYADSICALPGTSEHQTGLGLDVEVVRDGEVVQNSFPTDPEIKWLHDNSYKYGYILRYPEGSEDVTGYRYEHWHYRYIGIENSMKMHNEGIKTLEEYTAKYSKSNSSCL